MEILDHILELVKNPAFLRGLQLAGGLLTALILMQGVKAVIKQFWPLNWNPIYRTWFIFCVAYVVGFQAGAYFIGGDYSHKWAAFIGFSNPIIYYALCQYAKVKEHIILLSVLKMRPVVEVEGQWKLHETQSFLAKK